jgi:hypothetical protein
VQWPVVFAPFGVVGALARETIGERDFISKITLSVIITTDKVRASELSELIEDCPGIFEDHYESDYFKLALFMMYEWGKGEASFYYPYLNQIENPFSLI